MCKLSQTWVNLEFVFIKVQAISVPTFSVFGELILKLRRIVFRLLKDFTVAVRNTMYQCKKCEPPKQYILVTVHGLSTVFYCEEVSPLAHGVVEGADSHCRHNLERK